MIVLDTNVVSEPMRPKGDRAVLAWLDRQAPDTLYLTATSLAELLVGIDILPEGRRKQGLGVALGELLDALFAGRILPFDETAAKRYGSLVSRARAGGISISVADGQIASIAAAHSFMVATRDAGPFVAAGLDVIDPWRAE